VKLDQLREPQLYVLVRAYAASHLLSMTCLLLEAQ